MYCNVHYCNVPNLKEKLEKDVFVKYCLFVQDISGGLFSINGGTYLTCSMRHISYAIKNMLPQIFFLNLFLGGGNKLSSTKHQNMIDSCQFMESARRLPVRRLPGTLSSVGGQEPPLSSIHNTWYVCEQSHKMLGFVDHCLNKKIETIRCHRRGVGFTTGYIRQSCGR